MSLRWPPTSISVLTPVTPGREDHLSDHLAALGGQPRDESPFAALESVHMARLVVVGQAKFVPGVPRAERPLRMRYLLFSVVANRRSDDFFRELWAKRGRDADGVWDHCVGYPGSARKKPFVKYMRHNQILAQQTYSAFDATVPEINAALDLRRWHVAFALSTQDLEKPAVLQRAFRMGGGG